MHQLQLYAEGGRDGIREGLKSSGSWGWAWALDADERPPPSSIVARRDTQEAVKLARIADQAVLAEEDVVISGNNLWTLMVNFLTASPDKNYNHGHRNDQESKPADTRESKREKIRSRFAQLVSDRKKQPSVTTPQQ